MREKIFLISIGLSGIVEFSSEIFTSEQIDSRSGSFKEEVKNICRFDVAELAKRFGRFLKEMIVV